MQSYSLDLRQRVVRAYEQGKSSIAEIAAQFGVGQTFVKKMLRQKRETADLSPRPHGGGKPPSLKPAQYRLLQQKVRQDNDISLTELQSFLLQKAQLDVHVSTISRALKRLDLPRKKRA
jgi:transposase